MIWAIFLSRSMPFSNTMRANAGPHPYIQMGGLAPSTNSAELQTSEAGATWPPSSSGTCKRHHSASIHAL